MSEPTKLTRAQLFGERCVVCNNGVEDVKNNWRPMQDSALSRLGYGQWACSYHIHPFTSERVAQIVKAQVVDSVHGSVTRMAEAAKALAADSFDRKEQMAEVEKCYQAVARALWITEKEVVG